MRSKHHICEMGSIYTKLVMRNVVNVMLLNKDLGQTYCTDEEIYKIKGSVSKNLIIHLNS